MWMCIFLVTCVRIYFVLAKTAPQILDVYISATFQQAAALKDITITCWCFHVVLNSRAVLAQARHTPTYLHVVDMCAFAQGTYLNRVRNYKR